MFEARQEVVLPEQCDTLNGIWKTHGEPGVTWVWTRERGGVRAAKEASYFQVEWLSMCHAQASTMPHKVVPDMPPLPGSPLHFLITVLGLTLRITRFRLPRFHALQGDEIPPGVANSHRHLPA